MNQFVIVSCGSVRPSWNIAISCLRGDAAESLQKYEIWNYQGGVTIAVIFDKDLTFRQKIAECGRDAFCKRLI